MDRPPVSSSCETFAVAGAVVVAAVETAGVHVAVTVTATATVSAADANCFEWSKMVAVTVAAVVVESKKKRRTHNFGEKKMLIDWLKMRHLPQLEQYLTELY